MTTIKHFLGIAGCLLFMLLGVFLVESAYNSSDELSIFSLIAGLACLIFYGGLLFFWLFVRLRASQSQQAF